MFSLTSKQIKSNHDAIERRKHRDPYFINFNDVDVTKVGTVLDINYQFLDIYMDRCQNLSKPHVILHYGPYKTNGILKYRPQKLFGLIDCLQKRGYSVELVPSPHVNRLEVEMKGKEIARANIKYFLFNQFCSEDYLCREMIQKIEEATTRIYSIFNQPKIEETTTLETDKKVKTTTKRMRVQQMTKADYYEEEEGQEEYSVISARN